MVDAISRDVHAGPQPALSTETARRLSGELVISTHPSPDRTGRNCRHQTVADHPSPDRTGRNCRHQTVAGHPSPDRTGRNRRHQTVAGHPSPDRTGRNRRHQTVADQLHPPGELAPGRHQLLRQYPLVAGLAAARIRSDVKARLQRCYLAFSVPGNRYGAEVHGARVNAGQLPVFSVENPPERRRTAPFLSLDTSIGNCRHQTVAGQPAVAVRRSGDAKRSVDAISRDVHAGPQPADELSTETARRLSGELVISTHPSPDRTGRNCRHQTVADHPSSDRAGRNCR